VGGGNVLGLALDSCKEISFREVARGRSRTCKSFSEMRLEDELHGALAEALCDGGWEVALMDGGMEPIAGASARDPASVLRA
jgi:hypothetical protein